MFSPLRISVSLSKILTGSRRLPSAATCVGGSRSKNSLCALNAISGIK